MSKSLLERRHSNPDYVIEVWITGIKIPDNKIHWKIQIEGESDSELAAEILDRAAIVLRNK